MGGMLKNTNAENMLKINNQTAENYDLEFQNFEQEFMIKFWELSEVNMLMNSWGNSERVQGAESVQMLEEDWGIRYLYSLLIDSDCKQD